MKKQIKMRAGRIRAGMEDPIRVTVDRLDVLMRAKLNQELSRK